MTWVPAARSQASSGHYVSASLLASHQIAKGLSSSLLSRRLAGLAGLGLLNATGAARDFRGVCLTGPTYVYHTAHTLASLSLQSLYANNQLWKSVKNPLLNHKKKKTQKNEQRPKGLLPSRTLPVSDFLADCFFAGVGGDFETCCLKESFW